MKTPVIVTPNQNTIIVEIQKVDNPPSYNEVITKDLPTFDDIKNLPTYNEVLQQKL